MSEQTDKNLDNNQKNYNYKLISYTPDGMVTVQIENGPFCFHRHVSQFINEPTVMYGFDDKDSELLKELAKE